MWRPLSHRRFLQLLDYLTIWFGYLFAFFFKDLLLLFSPKLFTFNIAISMQFLIANSFTSLIYLFLLNYFNAYSFQRFTSVQHELLLIFKVTFLGLFANFIILYFFGYYFPRIFTVIVLFSTFLSLAIQKYLLFILANYIRKKGKNRKRIIIIGTGTRCEQFIKTINSKFQWGLDIIGIVSIDNKNVGASFYDSKVIGVISDLIEIIREKNPEEVIITLSSKNFNHIRQILEICEMEGIQVRLTSDFISHITKNVRFDNIYGIRIMSLYMVQQREIDQLIKRTFDIIFSTTIIILLLPLFIFAGIGIAITDGFPLIYNWNVVGLNKKPFNSWKFRTMVKNADSLKEKLLSKNEMSGPVFKIEKDPRIIPFGRWLRKWSVDELPQLFSVLKGDMSVVGPRPSGPHELILYESWQRRKLSVKPGLTCLWQVNGRNKIRDFNEWVKLDLEYIDNWSLWLDLKIFIKTIIIVLKGTGK